MQSAIQSYNHKRELLIIETKSKVNFTLCMLHFFTVVNTDADAESHSGNHQND